jgi:RNA polymerase sigma-70 factor (ECF subfamily)
MNEKNFLADQFEANRSRLRRVAYRMLGSNGEADDAVQEAWLRLTRTDAMAIDNLGGWLTTTVARVCLDTLRARKSHGEEPLDENTPETAVHEHDRDHPEYEIQLADAIGVALLVVLEQLSPPERVAFVLHDMFDMPFETIADIVERTPEATRQMASRARRRVQGAGREEAVGVVRQQEIVSAFLAASRHGDFQALMAVLAPDVVFRSDAVAVKMGGQAEILGAEAVANTFKGRAQAAQLAMMDGEVGIAVVFGGAVRILLKPTFVGQQIGGIQAIADPAVLQAATVTLLGQ